LEENAVSNVVTLTRRELQATFFSPIAYVVGAGFLLLSGYFFLRDVLVPGNEASMRPLFDNMARLLVFAVPLLTMRSLSDELSSGTLETLMTAPVTDAQVILGKFIGIMLFYVALLATTLLDAILLLHYAEMPWQAVAMGYLGLLLLGAAFTAVGLFASTLTRYQILAALIGAGLLAALTFMMDYLGGLRGDLWRVITSGMNLLGHFDDFSKGILDTRALVMLISVAAFFLFLAVKVLESRRWR
jgi:ABC-2 type transport system permease protein